MTLIALIVITVSLCVTLLYIMHPFTHPQYCKCTIVAATINRTTMFTVCNVGAVPIDTVDIFYRGGEHSVVKLRVAPGRCSTFTVENVNASGVTCVTCCCGSYCTVVTIR